MTPEPGAQIPTLRVRVDAERMKTFTLLTNDPNPIHWNVDAVIAAGLGDRVINQGGLNVGYIHRAVENWAGAGGTITRTRVRFLANAYAGDTLIAGGAVTSRAETDDGRNVDVTLDVWLRRIDGALLVVGSVTVGLPQLRK